ncbi:MAG: ethylbenzene dehydrogenase-related protein [Caldilineaceae bacterium]
MQQKIRRLTPWIVLFVAVLVIVACSAAPAAAPAAGGGGVSGGGATAGKANTLTAVKVDAASTDAAAAFWANAPILKVATKAVEKGKADGPEVSVQAVYDSKNFVMRLEWADSTNSIINKPWTWDGSAFTRTTELGDRMGVLFPIENNANFSSKGCAGICHNQDAKAENWWMGTDSADQRLDFWQWTAASTNPVNQVQDEWISVQKDPKNMESGTHPDAQKGGGSVSNVNKAKNGPISMNKDVTASIIITGEQVPVDTSKLAKGAHIPASILGPWTGSRGDIQAKGVWKDGKWTVVLLRPLDTGNDDDLVLTPPKSYPLGVAVFDQAEHFGHTVSPEVITLEWK